MISLLQIQIQKQQSQEYLMNPEYTSDIRLVDRFIFENSLYLLTMFEKKIDSLTPVTSMRQKIDKLKEKQALNNSKKSIDPETLIDEPIKNLAKDKTKPIWDCITNFAPRIICNSAQNSSTLNENKTITLISHFLHKFLTRYKNQHEDQSNLRLQIVTYDLCEKATNINQLKQNPESTSLSNTSWMSQELFRNIIRFANIQLQRQQAIIEDERISSEYSYDKIMYKATLQLLQGYVNGENHLLSFCSQLDSYNKIVIKNLIETLDTEIGPSVVALQPKLLFLPLLIHPLLIVIHNLIKFQMKEIIRKQEQKKMKNFPNRSQSYNVNKESSQIQKSYIYEDLKGQNCSRFVFLNLDGYEGEYNVDIAKYMSKNIMYISFLRQSSNKNQSSQLYQAQMAKSTRLLRKYYYSGLSYEQKQYLLRKYKDTDKQTKKNLYIFPINSQFLSHNFGVQGIQSYESTFITFILKQLIYNQILDYHPSCILVSYSGKLRIMNQDFTEIMKQLTVLGNYKVLFSANLAKNYLFTQPVSNNMIAGNQYLQTQLKHFQTYEKQLKILPTTDMKNINTEMFQKISIAIKVTSGTYNLSRLFQAQSYVKKYRNYKAMSYTSDLIGIIGNQNNNLSKIKMRLAQYSTVIRVLSNSYRNKSDTYQKLFGKALTKYHQNLLKLVQGYVSGEQKNYYDSDLVFLLNNIQDKYDQTDKKTIFDNFKFQYSLQISSQKTETHIFAHIPKYTIKNTKNYNKSCQNLLCLEFQILAQKQKISTVQIAPYTGIYYSQIRKHQNALIYVLNHFSRQNAIQYGNFYGIITSVFDAKMEPKVQLRPLKFEGAKPLPVYQTYTQFNYFETYDYCFLFWPKIYDSVKQSLHKIRGTTYVPQSSSLIFIGKRAQPHIMKLVNVQNEQIYKDIIPRHGCTCFEMVESNTIYIFGGFYGDEKNYLKFQTDITKLRYHTNFNADLQANPSIIVENIPKHFYFDYSLRQANSQNFIIDSTKNDIIRPKIQYQILPFEENNDFRTIFLVGGVGQNFVRPYSLISHMAHKAVFNISTGDLESLQRISTGTVFPVNVRKPVKTRSPLNLGIITNAQNRSINLVEGNIGLNDQVLSRNKLSYSAEEQKFSFQVQYQFGEIQGKGYKQQISLLKKAVIETQHKAQLVVKNARGKDHNTHFITLKAEADKIYILQLQLQLSLEVRNQNPQLLPVEKLTGSSLISIDINGPLIFALVKHPILTLDQCILSIFDINQLSSKLKDNPNAAVQMKQIHKFDYNVSNNILIAANSLMIAVLHGKIFQPEIDVPQLVLIRTKKNQIKTQKVKRSLQDYKQHLIIKRPGGTNTSLFLNKKDGIILCFSFKGIMKKSNLQTVFVIIERLNLREQQFAWEVILSTQIIFSIRQQTLNKRKDHLKLVQISASKKGNTDPEQTDYQLIGLYDGKCLKGKVNFKNHNGTVQFISENKTSSDYFNEFYKGSEKQSSVLLQKNSYAYSELNHGYLLDEE